MFRPRPLEETVLEELRTLNGKERPVQGLAERDRMRAAAARLLAVHGPEVTLTRIRVEAKVHSTAAGTYTTLHHLMADLFSQHFAALGAAVAKAEDDQPGLAPEALLERLILAWLEGVAAAPETHRAYLLCAHALAEEHRRSIELRRRIAIEQMHAALAAAVPELAARPEAPDLFFPLFRLLLSDFHAWPASEASEAPAARARRIAGMLIAAAEAEARGNWLRLGPPGGLAPGRAPASVSANRARARFAVVLGAAAAGHEVLITRHNRPAARVVAAEGRMPPKPPKGPRKPRPKPAPLEPPS
ncbi:MAG TPA: type II toxin-antitoxin system prevent-host-death family antitoxin [Acetobacteraceae bacterium]|nr:type II toxin-antitoxin system prevent-host-death family antitoxin [Acetobacteraceae bacterium]